MPDFPRSARRFLVTYAAGVVLFLVVGVIAIGVGRLVADLGSMGQRPGPPRAVQAPYALRYRSGDGPWTNLGVDAEGAACAVFPAAGATHAACVLATYVDPAIIATDAHGELNTADSFALIGITWRARLDGRAQDCDDAGLLGERLQRCRADVANPAYQFSDQGLTVSIGSAAP